MKKKTLKDTTPVTTELKAVFTNFTTADNWVNGTCGKFTFEAKLFDEGSSYGIKDGRVSKLGIYDNKIRKEKRDYFASAIVNYDRGWDIKPKTAEEKAIFKAVMKLLEESPKRFE